MYSTKSFLITVCVIFLFAGRSVNAASGDLDLSFGEIGTGTVMTPIKHSDGTYGGAVAYAAVVQPDDKIIAVGSVASYQSANPANLNYDIVLVRYNADGTLDSSFGSGGEVLARVNLTSREEAFAVALQPDGKIVAAGRSYLSGSNNFSLARFNPDGSLDLSFGTLGRVITIGMNGIVFSVGTQSDGKIVAVGNTVSSFGLARCEN